MLRASPSNLNVALVGEMTNVHGGGGAALCAIEICVPAIVTVPDLAAPVFACTDRETGPLPVPVAPAVIEIHGVDDEADQLQLSVVMTVEVTTVAADATECDVGVTLNEHVGGGAGGGGAGGGGGGGGGGEPAAP
jgi:hypothetical protein